MRIVMLSGLVLCLGCSLSAEERKQIIDESARQAGVFAAEVAYKKAIEHGMSPEEAAKVADLARTEGEKAATKIAERAIPLAEDAKSTKTGGIIASIFQFVLGAAISMGRRVA